jgi:hypothetical protein
MSAQFVKKQFDTLESSSEAEALKTDSLILIQFILLNRFQCCTKWESWTKLLKQADEVYSTLIKTVVPLRKAFRAELTVAGRQRMAEEEFKAWTTYL